MLPPGTSLPGHHEGLTVPTYVYACKNCDHRFEQYQSFSEDSLVTCPECAQDALRKVFDSVGIVFKGPGFYSTDSQSSGKGGTRGHGADAASASSAGGSDSSSTSASTSSEGSSGDGGTSSAAASSSSGSAASSSSKDAASS
nr:FmdB family zinc ribbon protein [Brachybacterium muris]